MMVAAAPAQARRRARRQAPSDAFPFEPIVAVFADALTPPGAPDPFWPTDLDISVGDIGCLTTTCGEEPGSFTGRSIRVASGDSIQDIPSHETVAVPGAWGEQNMIRVIEAREGACGTLANQQAWYSFSIVKL
jgi:hypothetical protein